MEKTSIRQEMMHNDSLYERGSYDIIQLSQGNNYEGYLDKEKRRCYIGRMIYHNGGKYQGEWNSNIKEGYGLYYYIFNDIYEGTFTNNKRNGIGIYTYSNGDKYEGEWIDDNQEGYGSFTYANTGLSYSGLFINNKLSSLGIITLNNQILYQGEISHDSIIGYGTYYYCKEVSYQGLFSNNLRSGYGREIYFNGDTFISSWFKDNPLPSYNIIFLKSGMSFESNDKIIIIVSEEFIYKGEHEEYFKEGYGYELIRRTNDLYEGEFKDNRRNGIGMMRYGNGDVYYGEWRDDRRNGHGEMVLASGEVYEGFFGKEEMNCFSIGKYTSTMKDIYEGEFVDWKRNGYGVLSMNCGEVIEGLFKAKLPKRPIEIPKENNIIKEHDQKPLVSLLRKKRMRSTQNVTFLLEK